MSIFRKTLLATTLAATAFVSASPAMARDGYHRDHDNTAAVAIGAGIIGLAIGAIVASSSNHDDRYRDGYSYNDSGYYGQAYNSGWYYRDGYYWDRDGRRYDRDEYNRYQRRDNRYYDQRRGYDRDHDDRRRGY